VDSDAPRMTRTPIHFNKVQKTVVGSLRQHRRRKSGRLNERAPLRPQETAIDKSSPRQKHSMVGKCDRVQESEQESPHELRKQRPEARDDSQEFAPSRRRI